MSDDPSKKPVNYKVGNKHPPLENRFKSGESGNPNGRPKGKRNFKSDLIAELEQTITIKEDGHDVTVSKQRAVIKSLIGNAIKGDVRATTALSTLVERVMSDGANSDQSESNDEDLKLLEERIEREVSRRIAMNAPGKDQQS
jgi:hypothetical protein